MRQALAALARGRRDPGAPHAPGAARLLPSRPTLPPRPVPVRFRKRVPTAWLELVLGEGRNRQVRRMTAAVGHPTLRLLRVAIGPLRLDALGLAPGAWRSAQPRGDATRSTRASAAKASSAPRPRANRPGSGSRLSTS